MTGASRLLLTVVCAAALAATLTVSRAPASALIWHHCRAETVVASPGGGWGLILERLRVYRISCAAGGRAAANIVYYGHARGWTCKTTIDTSCRSRARRIRFGFGGDAG
jgi:hypothetical protein